MDLNQQLTTHIGHLAKLYLSEEEKIEVTQELSRIIEYIEKLKELDTTGVEPTNHLLPMRNVFREDEANKHFSREELLKNAPKEIGGVFHVPQIVE